MDVLLTGRGLLESIRWHDDRLYVSDWSAGEVLAVPGGVVAEVASLPLCFDFLPDGRMVIVDSATGRLLDHGSGTHTDLGQPGWNDIAVDARGHVYLNRPDFTGPTGTVHLVGHGEVAGELAFPNGMAVTGETLIVAESHGHRLTAFDIAPDGSLGNRRVWAALGEKAAPDGICVDAAGAVWYADVPNRHCVRVAEGGEVLAEVTLDRGCFDCVVGGSTLYVAAAQYQGMSGELVAPGSGQVVAVPI
ncbi:SMP-30/gluconolactonase/LRE family protein [Actinophytocola oryzae]|uniref:Sugar lactone lactonase YvrE n=1 Tax=Actinophytocola oryzae TaxID=502181 RepID=A0A4R7USR3_9PSEU|nr:SMP-30/gluconolactonase/LRE family protein [Actinophytocola oryzae]TDV37583.1 sugar lactone lactonase YvrE [Actinophytocola oryzae]